MKKSIILLVAILVSFATFAQKEKSTVPKGDTAQQVKYTCTMHPEVVSGKMGSCSKCGSKLVVDRRGSKQATTVYTCAMHPEEVGNKAGKCPKCGMELTEVKAKAKPKKS
jgi:hypothetical protein